MNLIYENKKIVMIKNKYTWDLTPLYASNNDPQMKKDRELFKKAHMKFIKKWAKRSDYLEDPDVLAEALKEYMNLREGRVSGFYEYYYWELKRALNQTDANLIAKEAQYKDFLEKIEKQLIFFTNNLSKVSISKQKEFLNHPKLQKYKTWLEDLFEEGKHSLSNKEEQILMLESKTSYENWVDMINKLLSKEMVEVITAEGEMKKVPFNGVFKYLQDPNDDRRRVAQKGYIKILDRWIDVGTEELNSVVWHKKVSDELRHFKKCDDSSILSNKVNREFVEILLSSVEKYYKQAHRLYLLKSELLGKEKLNYNDRLIKLDEVNREIKFEEAFELVQKTFENVDPSLMEIIEGMLNKKQIDVYPHKGKLGGAFCTEAIPGTPIYVLLNFNKNIESVSTLAHELGHAVNHILTNRTQPVWYSGHSLAVAEVASTLFETFLMDNLLNNISDKREKYILQFKRAEDFIATVFRQTAFYRFEQQLHQHIRKKGYASVKEISSLFKEQMLNYLGPTFHFDEKEEFSWLYVSHFRYYFYVFSYVSGLMISRALYSLYKNKQLESEKILYFLSQGNNIRPIELFASLGLDITKAEFWENALDDFTTEIDWLESNKVVY